MKKKTIQLNLPNYITVQQYKQIVDSKTEGNGERLIAGIAALTSMSVEEVKNLPLNTIKNISDDLTELAFPKETFHAVLEFDDKLYGYAHMNQTTLGEYTDLENLSKDTMNNLHKIAAILYRPIEKNRFKSISFRVKQGLKVVNNKVVNPFEYYTIEKYNSDVRKDREELFKSFPAHVLLGALGFFLATAGLYLNHTLYLEKKITYRMKMKMQTETLENLSQSIGDGGELYTAYLNPTSYRSLGIKD